MSSTANSSRATSNAGRAPASLFDPQRRSLWIVVGVIILAAIGYFAYTRLAAPASTSTRSFDVQSLQAGTSIARRGNLTLSAIGSGTLQPANQVQLGFGGNTSGKLVTLNVKVSDQVTAGQLLAEIDNSQAKINYQQAQQSLL